MARVKIVPRDYVDRKDNGATLRVLKRYGDNLYVREPVNGVKGLRSICYWIPISDIRMINSTIECF